jgi:aspartate/methionine/tyrosine aminotransferase
VLAPGRRSAFIDWARRNDAYVIEDDYDGEFRYDQQPVGAMQALAPDRVIYAGSTSKTLAPGARLGWLTGGAAPAGPAHGRLLVPDGRRAARRTAHQLRHTAAARLAPGARHAGLAG